MSHKCCHHEQAATPRNALMAEHRVIEKVLDAAERMLQSRAVDGAFVIKTLDFLRAFADGCHHAKEEDRYFPELERRGVPRHHGPIGCMLEEHKQGRSLLREVERNIESADRGDANAVQSLRIALSAYIALLRQHIQKEDNVLFVMGEQVLSPDEKRLMLDSFNEAEQGDDPGKHERYVTLAGELSNWKFKAAA